MSDCRSDKGASCVTEEEIELARNRTEGIQERERERGEKISGINLT